MDVAADAFSCAVCFPCCVEELELSAGDRSFVPPEIALHLVRQGVSIDPLGTAELYLPLHEKEPYAEVLVMRDIAYGKERRQRLDIFSRPVSRYPKRRPVLIFAHGGGFSSGDKHIAGSPFFDNVGLWAVRNGLVGINMSYRLTPEAVWPNGAQDVANALQWVRRNIGRLGGDPAQVFLMGHAAGAVHVAGYIAHPALHVKPGGGVAGTILLSGLYELTGRQIPAAEQAYFGADTSLYAERSTLVGLALHSVPLLLCVAELDPPVFMGEFLRAQEIFLQTGRKNASTRVLAQHNHLSPVFSLNTDDSSLGGAIAEFIAHAGSLLPCPCAQA